VVVAVPKLLAVPILPVLHRQQVVGYGLLVPLGRDAALAHGDQRLFVLLVLRLDLLPALLFGDSAVNAAVIVHHLALRELRIAPQLLHPRAIAVEAVGFVRKRERVGRLDQHLGGVRIALEAAEARLQSALLKLVARQPALLARLGLDVADCGDLGGGRALHCALGVTKPKPMSLKMSGRTNKT
jgi:hypothetical protein